MKLRTILLLLATTVTLGLNAQGHVERPKKPRPDIPKPLPLPKFRLTPEQMLNKGLEAESAYNYGEAVKWYRKAADQGYATAQCGLGICYENGWGVIQDYTEAVKWYRKAADQGDVMAQDKLERLRQHGYY